MPRHLLLAVLAFAAVGAATAGVLNAAGTVQNKFTVTFNLIPDPFHLFSFFSMPRNLDEAFQDSWKLHYTMDDDDIQVHCRKNDYRVCVLFDRRGNVAGIRLSISAEELDNADLPIDIENTPEWRRWTFFEFGDVYSATVYFQSKEQIGAGGRHLTGNDLVIPEGLWILQTNQTGETGRLHVPLEESGAEAAGFREQDCFLGMGKHYFQELTPESTCEAHRPYFMLYGPQTNKLNGFGFTMYGKPSTDRGWFEHPPAIVAKAIAPNSPACMTDFINKYGMFTMHVYFIDNPKGIRC